MVLVVEEPEWLAVVPPGRVLGQPQKVHRQDQELQAGLHLKKTQVC
jgi:hypothetical protein